LQVTTYKGVRVSGKQLHSKIIRLVKGAPVQRRWTVASLVQFRLQWLLLGIGTAVARLDQVLV
jgi:hypothetical protein